MPPSTFVVVGLDDVGRRVCAALTAMGEQVRHLDTASDADIAAALQGDVAGVAVLLHDDIAALRYSLLVHHARPDVRLFVAIFDATVRRQLETAVPGCVVLSPAAIAVPSMVAAAVAPERSAIARRVTGGHERVAVTVGHEQPVTPYALPTRQRLRGWFGRLLGQLRPYDAGSAVLWTGVVGLLTITLIETVIGSHEEPPLRALYDAARTMATISSPQVPDEPARLVWSTVAALLVMAFTAMFAAGIVNYLLSGRHVSLVGRRVVPRSGHVVVVGMGQVGLRLAEELRSLGIAVVGVERYDTARTLDIARQRRIPVVVGDGSSRSSLTRAGLRRAECIVAAASEERDNIAVAVSALGQSPEARVVLRAGTDDAIAETRSLFHIGRVVDVNGLTSAYIAQTLARTRPFVVTETDAGIVAVDATGEVAGQPVAAAAGCRC